MSSKILVGYFKDEENILSATRAAREAGYPIQDVYTPYAVHGMDDAMGLRRSRLTWVTFLSGAAALIGAFTLQYWTSVVDWPLNVGGKPPASIPAFIPVCFELTVLVAALTTVGAFLARSGLFPGAGGMVLPGVTNDRFALALSQDGSGFNAEAATALMRNHGAIETGSVEVAR